MCKHPGLHGCCLIITRRSHVLWLHPCSTHSLTSPLHLSCYRRRSLHLLPHAWLPRLQHCTAQWLALPLLRGAGAAADLGSSSSSSLCCGGGSGQPPGQPGPLQAAGVTQVGHPGGQCSRQRLQLGRSLSWGWWCMCGWVEGGGQGSSSRVCERVCDQVVDACSMVTSSDDPGKVQRMEGGR